ncbi:MAG TPA: hypothetical protein VK465_10235 [Fibrobacteria bacterium]|nr:hypothetical protein [Fibrobacteria bacterium]
MSIRWIRSVQVDGRPATLEVMLGHSKIADKCYTRLDKEEERWFHPVSEYRQDILNQGIEILKDRLKGHQVLAGNGSAFQWH